MAAPTDRVSDLGEFELIRRITAGTGDAPHTLLGPGDDGAVLSAGDGQVVVTTDMLTEGVHFRLDWSSPDQVGRKAAAVNMADIAAMGAVPTGLVVSLGCPADTPLATLDGLAAGLGEEARRAGAGVVGGDLVTAGRLVVSVTALGDLQGRAPVRRGGARDGDVLAVCGRLGWAAAGLAVLGRGFGSPVAVVGAHRVPEPPYPAGPDAARAGASAMIDVSDGLLADAGHVAADSGLGIDIDSARLDMPQRLTEVASALGADVRHWVLTGGEDHALVATFPADAVLPPGWSTIGAVGPGGGVTVDGQAYEGPAGWTHFT